MISVLTPEGGAAILRLEGKKLGACGFEAGCAAIAGALESGARAILLDVAAVAMLRASDIARLIELAARALPQAQLSLMNVSPSLMMALRDQSVDQIIPLYPSRERAMAAADVKGALLAHTPAVVLCAGTGSRMAPLTHQTPKPMLDIMGRPVLEHILRHLRSFGIRDVVLNPGHLGPQIPAHFGSGTRTDQSIFYLNEGASGPQGWEAAPRGSASTLGRWAGAHNGLWTDTIVMCGDALVDVDLSAMMATHRASGADVTIAAQRVPRADARKYGIMATDAQGRVLRFQEKPEPAEALSTLANSGIYILSPAVAAWLGQENGADIACDLLPAILRDGGRVQVFDDPFQWIDIGCGRDYAAAWRAALGSEIAGISARAECCKPGIWLAPGAEVARLSDIEGPAFIGAGARIARGATLRGPVVIGAQSEVAAGSFIRNSILVEGTCARKGAWVDGMIASGHWAVQHGSADGSLQPRDPLPEVAPIAGDPGYDGDIRGSVSPRFQARPVVPVDLARAG